MPKEMLTIVDRPVVQYAVDEAIEAGIEHIVFVTSRNKSAIEDHFDDTPELHLLAAQGGQDQAGLRTGAPSATRRFDQLHRQQAPLGLRSCRLVRARPDR